MPTLLKILARSFQVPGLAACSRVKGMQLRFNSADDFVRMFYLSPGRKLLFRLHFQLRLESEKGRELDARYSSPIFSSGDGGFTSQFENKLESDNVSTKNYLLCLS